MKPKPGKLLNLDHLDPETRARVQRALRPKRDTTLSLDFNGADIAHWKACAARRDIGVTDWIEERLNGIAESEDEEARKGGRE